MKHKLNLIMVILLTSCYQIDVEKEYDRGIKLYEKQYYSEAIEAFSNIINKTDTCLKCFLKRGHSYRNISQLIKAKEDFNKLIKSGDDNYIKVGYMNRGGTFYDEQNYELALLDYKKALEYDPQNGTILNMVSHMLFATDNRDSGCYYYWESIKYTEPEFDPEIPEYCDSLRTLLEIEAP